MNGSDAIEAMEKEIDFEGVNDWMYDQKD